MPARRANFTMFFRALKRIKNSKQLANKALMFKFLLSRLYLQMGNDLYLVLSH